MLYRHIKFGVLIEAMLPYNSLVANLRGPEPSRIGQSVSGTGPTHGTDNRKKWQMAKAKYKIQQDDVVEVIVQ